MEITREILQKKLNLTEVKITKIIFEDPNFKRIGNTRFYEVDEDYLNKIIEKYSRTTLHKNQLKISNKQKEIFDFIYNLYAENLETRGSLVKKIGVSGYQLERLMRKYPLDEAVIDTIDSSLKINYKEYK